MRGTAAEEAAKAAMRRQNGTRRGARRRWPHCELESRYHERRRAAGVGGRDECRGGSDGEGAAQAQLVREGREGARAAAARIE